MSEAYDSSSLYDSEITYDGLLVADIQSRRFNNTLLGRTIERRRR